MPNSCDNSKKIVGLTEQEVKESRIKHGKNSLTQKKKKGFLRNLLENFGDPIIRILLIALAINTLFLFHDSDWFESVGIAIAIFLAVFIATISEYGNESAFEKLQAEASKIKCRVKRDNRIIQISIEEIVVGDIVLLQSGDKVPADGIIVDGQLDLDQSALNGESKEAKKYVRKEHIESKIDFLSPTQLFSGTVVCAGEGMMRVTEIGDKTFYGKIATEIQEETRETPLRVRLGNLAKSISKFGYIAAGITVIAYLYNAILHNNSFDMTLVKATLTTPNIIFGYLLKSITLAVAVLVMSVPEGLPMMITVVLSSNMKRMLKDNVLVRKLVGIETAGSLNLLFTDKTGTLTTGKLNVTHFISGSGDIWGKNNFKFKDTKLSGILYDTSYYNNSASIDNSIAIGGNATDRSILEYVSGLGEKKRNIQKVNVIPFSSEAKFMATEVTGDWNASFIKGAPEKILAACTSFYDENGNVQAFTNHSKINSILKDLSSKAIRVIAVAVSDNSITPGKSFGKLKLVGLLGIRDEIRKEVLQGVKEVQTAGIQIIMITGDSKATATAIAKEVGIIRKVADITVTSDELNSLSDEEVVKILPDLRVVARALPSDKSRLVRIAQEQELVVGMTGDGVNDAPALKKADIGFGMGSGTEIAKEASDIVILDDNFNSISKAICYGRTIFKSIRKFLTYQLSTCICAVATTVIGSFMGIDAPITIIQILWINIVMDTLSGIAFSGEKARAQYMKEAPKTRDETILNKYMINQIVINSIYTTIICLLFLKGVLLNEVFTSKGNLYMLTGFFTLFMFLAIFRAFCVRTHAINLIENLASNKTFLAIMGSIATIQIILVYFGGSLFRTVKLDVKDLVFIILVAITIIPIDTIRKHILKRRGELTGT